MFPAHEEVCTGFTGAPQWRKLLSPSFLAIKQACTYFTAPPRRRKRLFSEFHAHEQVCTSFTGPPQGRKLFLYLYWHFHKPARDSMPLFGGENGVVWCFPHINRLPPPPQWWKLLSPSFLALKVAGKLSWLTNAREILYRETPQKMTFQ